MNSYLILNNMKNSILKPYPLNKMSEELAALLEKTFDYISDGKIFYYRCICVGGHTYDYSKRSYNILYYQNKTLILHKTVFLQILLILIIV